ncbi:UPF0061-domain-containing protein [Ascobolus immersus RN42]|uniref:Selenoprotein O n=1 Tax=Ascobolus immersus RN42 TaxID=1160509 RepID=A0A3N4IHV8_ASCIM|nr:UPF0061-domain-containing protein [Ascobolus immersus RN42]
MSLLGPNTNLSSFTGGVTLDELPKSHVFTTKLKPDAKFPTPEDSDKALRSEVGQPRMVKNAHFTWVRPDDEEDEPELLAVSPNAMRDLGIKFGEEQTEKFQDIVSGKQFYKEHYPWSMCYGGWQFGSWAGQLGDGRAISLFEATNPETGIRHELQLKGAGMTPYSRFADGRAVLRSSIREFLVSEHLRALHIPSTGALSLTLTPSIRVIRERIEPGAIVARYAQSWIRIGNFDIFRARGDRAGIRQLTDYVLNEVYGGEDKLPAPQEDSKFPENRYVRLYRAIVRRNAETVAHWQTVGFMNGVLNTDNTSIIGLSLDFGPFAFMDQFDPNYTPNHDDYTRRYSFGNQPSVIWWNLVRLGEDLAELLGAADVDNETFMTSGVQEDEEKPLIERAEYFIKAAGEEYKLVFLTKYLELMSNKLGFRTVRDTDMDKIYSPLLDLMEKYELDFTLTFRKLCSIPTGTTFEEKVEAADVFVRADEENPGGHSREEAKTEIAKWLEAWEGRLVSELPDIEGEKKLDDKEREQRMKQVNPHFIPRGWLLNEIIEKVEKRGDREILGKVMAMSLRPFEDSWGTGDEELEKRFSSEPPKVERAIQCSCSS